MRIFPKIGDLVTCLDMSEKHIVEIREKYVVVSDKRANKNIPIEQLEYINSSLWCEIYK